MFCRAAKSATVPASMPDYRLEPALARASLDDYVQLFRASFGGDDKLNEAYLRWQYVDNPHGRVIGVDAYAGDTLAAHYAIIPRRYRLGTIEFRAALSVNTATHPAHQGKGLFVRLAQQTYAAAADAGVQFVVGVANANSVGGFTRRLGFAELGRVGLFFLADAPDDDRHVLDVAVDADWLGWRLANPSRQYLAAESGGGRVTLATKVRSVPFKLARVNRALLAGADPAASLLPHVGLTPWFGPTDPPLLRLPPRLQPSPWHVIWKPLSDGLDPTLCKSLRISGLAMDTL